MKHAFISVRDSDKPRAVGIAKQLIDLGFKILATDGTFKVISEAGLECERVNKVTEGRPNIVDRIKNGEIHLVINTTEGKRHKKTHSRSVVQHFKVKCIIQLH